MKTIILNIFLLLLAACGTDCKNGIQLTNSSIVSRQRASEMNELFSPFKSNVFYDSIHVNYNMIKGENYKNIVELFFKTPTKTISNQIQIFGSLLNSNENTYVEVNNNIAYVAWVSEPNYDPKAIKDNHCFELYLKSINLNNGKEYFNNKIYSTKCCINRLSMKYNPFTKSVLFSYNDFSRPKDNYLMFGAIKLQGNLPLQKLLSPISIESDDGSEYNFPQFISDSKSIYLYHTTGDSWGLFSYSGKTQLGISRIDNNNSLKDYKIIKDACAIHNKLVLINDTVFFEVRIEKPNESDRMLMKKIALKNLTEN